jgi:hypothetical protein
VQAGVLGGGRGRRVRLANAGGCVRGGREDERDGVLTGAGRVHARRARVHGDREPNAGGVRQPGLPHGVRWQRHALWVSRRRRITGLCVEANCSPVALLSVAQVYGRFVRMFFLTKGDLHPYLDKMG